MIAYLPGSDEELARRGVEDPSQSPGFCHDADGWDHREGIRNIFKALTDRKQSRPVRTA
jgi:hypothetical protein